MQIMPANQYAGLHEERTAAKTLHARAPRTMPVGDCPVCGALAARTLFTSDDLVYAIAGKFTYRRCRRCRSVFQDPRVVNEDIGLCYPEGYYTHEPNKEGNAENGGVERDSRQLAAVREWVRNAISDTVRGEGTRGFAGVLGRTLALSRRMRERAFYDRVADELIPHSSRRLRALDVGCGAGNLMLMLARVGWEVAGVEWDPRAACVARKASGQPVFEGDFRDVAPTLGQYDLVVLHHVFEHLEDPGAALRTIKELLLPGGKAVLVFPNPRSLGTQVFRSKHCNWDPPRHLVLPDRSALARLANDNGLSTIQVRTSARHAASFFAFSRALGRGGQIDPAAVAVAARDRVFGALAHTLVLLGFQVGEEVFVTLKSRDKTATLDRANRGIERK